MTPDAHTIQELFIEVGDGHELYVQDWGNKEATLPIFHLHGGPGSGTSDRHKGTYDPSRQRVIFHDQRGCGRSLPYGSLEQNTTQNLIEDISKIADKLGIERFVIAGGSWGSCLALAYALQHPHRVEAMVLHGIYTGSKDENDWIEQGLFQTFYPDVWQSYLDLTPKEHHANPGDYHIPRALKGNKESLYAISFLEGAVLNMDDRFTPSPIADFDPIGTLIETTYLHNLCYMEDRYILDNAHKIAVPTYLVQGRYDMVCPSTTAYELSLRLPNSELIWTTSGHRPERESWNIMRTLLLQLSAT